MAWTEVHVTQPLSDRSFVESVMLPDELRFKPGYLIRRAQQIAVSIFLDECRDVDITPMQYAVLRVLSESPELDQITLASRAAIDRSTIGGLAERLEEKGWISRKPGVEDRRQKLIALTQAGIALLESVEVPVERVQQRLLAPLNDEERAVFMTLLARVVDENNENSRAPLKR